MTKRVIILGVAAVVGLSGLTTAGLQADELKTQFDKNRVISELRDRGIDVQSVETWSDTVRAFVRQPDGSITMQFFKPGSLQRVIVGS